MYGVPSVLTSDSGAQFTSSIWTSVCCSLGISLSTTTSFHPQSNGIIEQFHRSLKTAFRARLAGLNWFPHLPLVLLGLQSVPKEDTGFSVSKAVFGSPLTVPDEVLEGGEIPPSRFLQKFEQAVSGFAGFADAPDCLALLLPFLMSSWRVVRFCHLDSYRRLNRLSAPDSRFLNLIMFLLLHMHLFCQPC